MLNQPIEQPLYSASQAKGRALIPKALSLIVLAIIFYLGVLLNISLLELDAQQETQLKTGALILLSLLILLGLLLALRKTWTPYLFFRDRITFGKESIHYANINEINTLTNNLDKIFKTNSIQLEKKFFLRYLPQSLQLANYIQQLVNYTKNKR